MYHSRRFRLTPPWPPGLETLRKALLGPARYRQPLSGLAVAHVYDDTVLIALALNAYFEQREDGFRLNAPGLSLHCRVDDAGAAPALAALLLQLGDEGAATAHPPQAFCLQAAVVIQAQVDDLALQHRAWIAQRKQRAGLRWNPAVLVAMQTLRARSALARRVDAPPAPG